MQLEVDDALDKFSNKDSKSWTKKEKGKDNKALTQIQLHLSNNFCKMFCRRKLQHLYGSSQSQFACLKDLTNKIHMKMKLYTHKLRKGGSMLNHLSVIKKIVLYLQAMELDYDEEDFGLILLCSLPSSFANFRDI